MPVSPFARLALGLEALTTLREARADLRARPELIDLLMVPSPPLRPTQVQTMRRIGRTIDLSGRLVRRSTCLVRAVAAHRIGVRQGIATTLCLGHDAQPGRPFVAHAWLEAGGATVYGVPSPTRFQPVHGEGHVRTAPPGR